MIQGSVTAIRRAIGFYERHGFKEAATLPGLVAEGYDEILLRKFPLRAGGHM